MCAVTQLFVCELLMFIQNKINIWDEQMLMRVCEDHYSEAEVESAKELLTSHCGGVSARRKGDNKRKRSLQDIFNLMKTTDPQTAPTYVAKDLGKLPSITFDYVDVTSVLRDIQILKRDMHAMKMEGKLRQDTDVEMRKDLEELKKSRNNIENIPIKQPGQPTPLPPPDNAAQKSYASAAGESKPKSKKKPAAATTQTGQPKRHVSRTTPRDEGGVSQRQPVTTPDGFTTVSYKRKKNVNKNKFIIGTSSNCENISGVPRRKWLFISRVNSSATEKDITDVLLKNQISADDVQCVKIAAKTQRNYANFRICVKATDVEKLMSPSAWPRGVGVREYIWVEKKRN